MRRHFKRLSLEIDKISEDEVYRTLGYRGQEIDQRLRDKISRIIAETISIAKIRAVLQLADLEEGPKLLGITLPGEGIREHLAGSHSGAIFAVTLGTEIEMALRRYSVTEVDTALIMDAAASVLVETACDTISDMFEKEMRASGLYTTERFSPGYSDLPLSLQPEIVRVLDAPRQIGLSVTDHDLLTPRKSVTAIIGVRDEPRKMKSDRCQRCILKGRCKFGICSYPERTR